MGYAMIVSNVALRCPGAAEKVPQVARPGSILRHCGTCGTPYVEEKMAHWRTLCLARAAQCFRGGAHAAGAFGLPRCARWPAGAPTASAEAGRRAHQFIVACLAASGPTHGDRTAPPMGAKNDLDIPDFLRRAAPERLRALALGLADDDPRGFE
jgi:hypothetical protein